MKRLTVDEAAKVARVTAAQVRAAVEAGDLRDLTPAAVQSWARARVAAFVTASLAGGRS